MEECTFKPTIEGWDEGDPDENRDAFFER